MAYGFHHVKIALEGDSLRLPTEGLRLAAVAAIFVDPPDRSGPKLLFMRRAERVGDHWSGHVSFPGGHREPGDADLLDTAIRETREEIGVDLSPDACIGTLSDQIAVPRPDMLIRPYVFRVSAIPPVSLNHEVASLHRLDLDTLLSDAGRGSMELELRGHALTLPCVDFDGVRLWGLTLRMVDELLHRIDGRGTGLVRFRGTNKV